MMQLSVDDALGNLRSGDLRPGEVLIATLPHPVTHAKHALWKERLKELFPDNDVFIVSDAIRFNIVSRDQTPEGGSDGE